MVCVTSVALNSVYVSEQPSLNPCKNYSAPLKRGCVKVVNTGIVITTKTEQNFVVGDVLISSKISHYDL